MQKLFLTFTLSAISLFCYSQYNLQFNKVITYVGKFDDVATFDSSATWVVPTNKVWKIAAMTNFQTNLFGGTGSMSFNLNGVPIKIYDGGGNTYTENYYSPIWLKAGDAIKYFGFTAQSASYFLSIIEYNLIP